MAEIIEFTPRKSKPLPPSPEEIHNQKLQLIEDCIDRNIRNFVVDVVENLPDVNEDLVEEIDMQTQKTIGLLRETMRATIFKFQDIHHDLQDVADEIIVFEEDAREQIIEGN